MPRTLYAMFLPDSQENNEKNKRKTPTKTTKVMLNYVDTAKGMTYNEHRKLCHGTTDIYVADRENIVFWRYRILFHMPGHP